MYADKGVVAILIAATKSFPTNHQSPITVFSGDPPALEPQAWNSLELSKVRGHQSTTRTNRLRRNEKVIRADRVASRPQGGAYLRRGLSGRAVKRDHRKRSHEQVDLTLFGARACAQQSTSTKLKNADGRNSAVIRTLLCQFGYHRTNTPQHVDAGIRIEKKHDLFERSDRRQWRLGGPLESGVLDFDCSEEAAGP